MLFPLSQMIGAANTFHFSETACTGVLFHSQQAVILKAAAPHLADKKAPRRSPYKLTAADSAVELLFITIVGEPSVRTTQPGFRVLSINHPVHFVFLLLLIPLDLLSERHEEDDVQTAQC